MAISAANIFLELVRLKVREDKGANKDSQGIIAMMNKAVGVAVDSPYCASTVSHCFKKATSYIKNLTGLVTFPYTASSQAVKRWFKNKSLLSYDVQNLLHWKGAVAGWTNVGDSWHGHVFLVLRRFTVKDKDGNLKIVAIETAEGNTSASGSREGSGIYILRRKLFDDGLFYPVDKKGEKAGPGHKLWFCNTSDIAGGSWWG